MSGESNIVDPSVFGWIASYFSWVPVLHPFWHWITLALAVVATVMATPSFLQILFGKPEIVLETEERIHNGKKELAIVIRNKEIEKRWLTFFRISRDPAKVLCLISIFEHGTGRVICEDINADIVSQEGASTALVTTLYPSIGSSSRVVESNTDGQTHYRDFSGNLTLLEPGTYDLRFDAASVTYMKKSTQINKTFRVGNRLDELTWRSY